VNFVIKYVDKEINKIKISCCVAYGKTVQQKKKKKNCDEYLNASLGLDNAAATHGSKN